MWAKAGSLESKLQGGLRRPLMTWVWVKPYPDNGRKIVSLPEAKCGIKAYYKDHPTSKERERDR